MEKRNLIYDVLVIGAGPAGLTASIFAHTKNLKVLALEGLNAGGQLKNLYPHKLVYNYPGYSKVKAGILADHILDQFSSRSIPVLENSPVQKLSIEEDGIFNITTTKGILKSFGIIIACGMGVFQPKRLGVTGEDALQDKRIFYSISNIDKWKNKTVVVFGGGNSAVDNALLLKQNGCRVILVHLLPKFQADASGVEEITNNLDNILLEFKAKHFAMDSKGAVSVNLSSAKNGAEYTLTTDYVLINIGLKPDIKFLAGFPIVTRGKQVIVDTNMQTSIAGVFACGDIVYYPGKVRLITTAIGEAATALNSLEKYLKAHTFRYETGVENAV